MKTPLGTEVDLGPGHIVLDGVPVLRERGTAAPPLFGPCLLWPRSPISATAELLFKMSFMNTHVACSGWSIFHVVVKWTLLCVHSTPHSVLLLYAYIVSHLFIGRFCFTLDSVLLYYRVKEGRVTSR